MGSVGLALPWEHRITPVEREGKSRVAFSERESQAGSAAVNPEDAALAAACQAGDLHAYERLYRWQGARMRNLARNLLGTQSDAEDAVQETFLKVQRSIGTFRGQSSFVTWAKRICSRRKRRRSPAGRTACAGRAPLAETRAGTRSRPAYAAPA
jgi:Sigma-70 region 2